MIRHLRDELSRHGVTSLLFLLILAAGFALRFIHLGYSDFQGDEIKTFCRIAEFDGPLRMASFLLRQSKGPVQYLVTCLYGIVDPGFSSELGARLPFALASFATLIAFYGLVSRLTSGRVALFSSLLLATNGLFVAFGRIVQYQSFTTLGVVVGLLSLTLANQEPRWRVAGLYLGSGAAAVAAMTHFDAAFALLPITWLAAQWWGQSRRQPNASRLRRHGILATSMFGLLVAPYYLVYFSRVSPEVTQEWASRFAGTPTSAIQIFRFYNPDPVIWLYLALIPLGLVGVGRFKTWPVLLVWILPPLFFMEALFRDSRTHAYTYILPLLVVAGAGMDTGCRLLKRKLGPRLLPVSWAFSTFLIVGLGYLSYQILVDPTPEYPWEPKRVLGMNLPGGRLAGTFGFPYARGWRQVGRWFDQLPPGDIVVATNEKRVIAEFYLPPTVEYKYQHPGPPPVRPTSDVYVVLVEGPQSWMDQLWGWSIEQWAQAFVPVWRVSDGEGRTISSVYHLGPEDISAILP